MKNTVALFILLFMGIGVLFGQKKKILPAVSPAGVEATYTNVSYGDHQKNVFDIWLAESKEPTPLVIYIHGGGFVGGDKSKIYESSNLDEFLKAGISFASINYRFLYQLTDGIPGCMRDSKRAVQYIRHKASDWNIDKERIAIYGGSAGAGTTLWLGLHDEMADPDSDDPVLQESTRVRAIGAMATQATYDFTKWEFVLEVPYPNDEMRKASLKRGAMALGLASVEDLESEKGKAIRADVDFLNLISPDDPPVYIRNKMEGEPVNLFNMNQFNHHPLHAMALKKELDKIEHEAQVYAPGLGVAPPEEEQLSIVEFFIKHLTTNHTTRD